MSKPRAHDRIIIDRELAEMAGVVPDEVSDRWLADIGKEAHPTKWTGALVQERLSAAMDTLARCVARPGPKGVRSVMPEFEQEPLSIKDMIDKMTDENLHRLDNKIMRSAMTREVSRMEEAILWPWRYLQKWPGPLRVLNTFLYARTTRQKWARVLRRRGIPYSTAKDARAKACRIIADGLNRDGVPVQ